MKNHKKHPKISQTNLLVEELKMGSYKAFNALYELYVDLLYGYIFGLIRSHSKTEEIVQETFIKVWLHKAQISTDSPFKAWLYKIAKNQLIDNYRHQITEPLFEDYLNHCENEDLFVSPDMELDFELFIHTLRKAKSKLSPRQLEVFELSKEFKLSNTEIAERLNISKQAVYNYLSQALNLLRKEMKDFSFLFFLLFY